MGGEKAFYIHSGTWHGGETAILKMRRLYYDMKIGFKHQYFTTGGKLPHWQWTMGTWISDKI